MENDDYINERNLNDLYNQLDFFGFKFIGPQFQILMNL